MKKVLALTYLAITGILLMSFKVTPPLYALVTSTPYEDSLNEVSYVSSNSDVSIDVDKLQSVVNDADIVADSGLDSLQIRQIADLAYNVGLAANGGKEFIKGVPNPLLHLLTGGLLGLTIHWVKNAIKRRKERKKNKSGTK